MTSQLSQKIKKKDLKIGFLKYGGGGEGSSGGRKKGVVRPP
jgi:hypothetical protein